MLRKYNVKMWCLLALLVRLVFVQLTVRADVYVEIDIDVHVNIHILDPHVICRIAHLIQEQRVLSLGRLEKVVLCLEKTLIHNRVHVVANSVVQRSLYEVVVRNASV